MQPKTLERWQFSASVLLPVILALVITAAAVLGFVFWSTANIDQRALERQSSMVAQVIEARRAQVQHDLESVAIWDDAVVNAKLYFNFDWVDSNLGAWMYEFFGHNRSVIIGADGTPIYAMEGGAAAASEDLADMAASVRPIVERVRAIRPAEVAAGEVPPPAAASDFMLLDGRPAIVSAMAIVTDSGELMQSPGSEAIMVGVLFLDEAAAERLNREYLFEAGRFVLTESRDPARAVYPILSSTGRFIAFFEWDRDRPGLLMLRQTGPALVAAFIVAAILVFLLLRQLRRSSSELENGRRLAEHQAAHDKLTGLPNRVSFDTHLADTLTNGKFAGAHIALLMLDLDRFKQVNDTLGHQAGDDLIRAVGDRIRAVVGHDMMIARLGGDEFGILAVGQHGPVDVVSISTRIIDSIGQSFTLNHFKAHVGASIGIVLAEGGSAEPRELVRKADIALYEAKAGGRNRAVVYEEHMNELLQLQHTIEGELREALRRDDQLSVVFQPLVDQHSRKVIGAEALARWHHPKYGQISPARFIPIAENTGLIEALGDFVLRRACELGATAPGRTIAVNISPTQLRNPRFSHQVFDILRETGMRPLDLELEITESILLDDEHISSQNLRTFRTAGVHIALDDFGTGYSSLSYLKRYPVDRIKIDRSFVSQLAEGHVSVAITQAIVTLAHAMDIEVTAEGVETEGQAAILGKLGCNTLQGFLFSGGVVPGRIAEIFADPANAVTRRRRKSAA
ncbi:putative bifunctional diguanylate cyclase/phosphodiesterase [Devosia sp. SL43]|uniref:putative bifunctional diguanylate cyclase/phosphodiesterase n=1 Tax=Devosia sp. SL43 TaxID=2806348 RepID=UPI001F377236|nr:EAL domain-containing protein [Devosia sp. SL43]UJW87043.1 EAL domain-containing protein [Devosia sp. SL43]